jgi:hypothetical protein
MGVIEDLHGGKYSVQSQFRRKSFYLLKLLRRTTQEQIRIAAGHRYEQIAVQSQHLFGKDTEINALRGGRV